MQVAGKPVSAPSASADSDTLLPVTFASFQADLKRALTKGHLKEPLAQVTCLEGNAEKRKVCTYKLGEYMSVMISSAKGGSDVVGLTMMCGPKNDLDSAKCLLAYSAAMALTASALSVDARGKILGLLFEGLALGNDASITTDERKFTLQKSIGVWFHIYATDTDDAN
jgi:hypothetical protein